MKKQIIILGTGSNSLELVEMLALPDFNDMEVAGFLDDGLDVGSEVYGHRILGGLADAPKFGDAFFVNGIGSPSTHMKRDTFVEKTSLPSDRFQTIVHPSASVSPRAKLGHGVVLFQNVVIGTGATIGNHVIVLPQTTVSHDTQVGDHTCLATGVILSGNTTIGELCYIGAGCVTREKSRIGSACLIGAGAVVIHDIPSKTVAIGTPARPINKS